MIRYLVPDLPRYADLAERFEQIDQAKRYTNGGPLLGELEAKIAMRLDPGVAIHALGTSSGTTALEVGLQVLGLPKGARVLTPALSFPAAALAILRAGLVPVFLDVDPDTWMLTPDLVRRSPELALASAVIPVSSFGHPQPAKQWGDFVDETGLPVLVDAAGSFGRQPVDPRILVAFSLHATKPFGVGEGGLLVLADPRDADRARKLLNFGYAEGVSTLPGANGKMSEYSAAIGLVQLERLPAIQARRDGLFAVYRNAFAGADVTLQTSGPVAPSTVAVRLPVDGADMQRTLAAEGIETRRAYIPALHRHPTFAGVRHADMPVTAGLERRLLALPFHTSLGAGECAHVAERVLKLVRTHEPAVS